MKRVVGGAAAVAVLALGGVIALAVGTVAGGTSALDHERRAARGKDLFWSIGCNDCRTPKKLGPNGPELDTERTLRTGRHMGTSRQILPPMPWEVYGRLSDEDLKSIYAYLRSVPPVSNRVPEPVIATN